MSVLPDAGFDLVFGRCEPDVHVCVGANDRHVSRRHGYITYVGHLRPEQSWTWRRTAHIVTKVRKRLSSQVRGLLEEEVPPPLGNTLNHNLITELLVSATITKSDLRLLDVSDQKPGHKPSPIPAKQARWGDGLDRPADNTRRRATHR